MEQGLRPRAPTGGRRPPPAYESLQSPAFGAGAGGARVAAQGFAYELPLPIVPTHPVELAAKGIRSKSENELFVESLEPELRRDVLYSADSTFLASLPVAMQEEAERARSTVQAPVPPLLTTPGLTDAAYLEVAPPHAPPSLLPQLPIPQGPPDVVPEPSAPPPPFNEATATNEAVYVDVPVAEHVTAEAEVIDHIPLFKPLQEGLAPDPNTNSNGNDIAPPAPVPDAAPTTAAPLIPAQAQAPVSAPVSASRPSHVSSTARQLQTTTVTTADGKTITIPIPRHRNSSTGGSGFPSPAAAAAAATAVAPTSSSSASASASASAHRPLALALPSAVLRSLHLQELLEAGTSPVLSDSMPIATALPLLDQGSDGVVGDWGAGSGLTSGGGPQLATVLVRAPLSVGEARQPLVRAAYTRLHVRPGRGGRGGGSCRLPDGFGDGVGGDDREATASPTATTVTSATASTTTATTATTAAGDGEEYDPAEDEFYIAVAAPLPPTPGEQATLAAAAKAAALSHLQQQQHRRSAAQIITDRLWGAMDEGRARSSSPSKMNAAAAGGGGSASELALAGSQTAADLAVNSSSTTTAMTFSTATTNATAASDKFQAQGQGQGQSQGQSHLSLAGQTGDASEGPIYRRVLLPFQVGPQRGAPDKWLALLSLKQPQLLSSYSPQGTRPDALALPPVESRERAVRMAESLAPPKWMPKSGGEQLSCKICRFFFAPLRQPKHCRNCGVLVCTSCSDYVPKQQLPHTYHRGDKSVVRVCFSCQCLHERFISALWAGDAETAHSLYSIGNINLYSPLACSVSQEYPVHAAARGGSMTILRWLLEGRCCPLKEVGITSPGEIIGRPLLTSAGLSVLGVAALFGHKEMMVYLAQVHGCSVGEISGLEVALRGLHAALAAPGEAPRLLTDSLNGSAAGEGVDCIAQGGSGGAGDESAEAVPQQARLLTGHPAVDTFPQAEVRLRRVYDVSLYRLSPDGLPVLPDERMLVPLLLPAVPYWLLNLNLNRAVAIRRRAAAVGLTMASSKRKAGLGQGWEAAEALVDAALRHLQENRQSQVWFEGGGGGGGAGAGGGSGEDDGFAAAVSRSQPKGLPAVFFGYALPYVDGDVRPLPLHHTSEGRGPAESEPWGGV